MKKLICCLAVLVGSASCFAEDQPQPRGNRGNWDPEKFRQQMLERIKDSLGSSDDE